MTKRTKKEILLELEKHLSLQDLTVKQYGRWLTTHLSFATEHLPDKGELIFKVFKECVIMLLLIKRSAAYRKRIICMLGCQQKSSWTIFLDKLSSSSEPSTLSTFLLRILVRELILREKVFRPFWTPAYKAISEKLLLPIETDSADSDSNSSITWSQSQVEKSRFLTIRRTKHVNKNSPTTSSPSSTSFLVDKWANEVMPLANLRTLKVRIYPSKKQETILNEFINTSRYVYNRTLEFIKKGHQPNFQSLRDILVSENTKKGYDEYKAHEEEIKELRKQKKECTEKEEKEEIDEIIKEKHKQHREYMKKFAYVKNQGINDWELFTPKDVRASAVKRCCDAYKTGFTNVKRGHIKFFNLKYKKKIEQRQSFELTPKCITVKDGNIRILPDTFKDDCYFKVSASNKKKLATLEIENNVDVVRDNGNFFLHVSISTEPKEKQEYKNTGSVDLGVRTFGTVHTHSSDDEMTTIAEYKHNASIMKMLNRKIDRMKKTKKHYRKKQYTKIEDKKSNLVDLSLIHI